MTPVVLDGIILVLVLLIARGLPLGEALALRRPVSWRDAVATAGAVLVAIYLVSIAEETLVGHAVREQAVPQYWDPTQTAAFAANVLVVAVFVPIVEEALTRGIGFYLLAPWGTGIAIIGSAVGFALAHGAITDLPWVLVTGLGLGCLRARSGSLYPGMLLHGLVNGVALLASAALAVS